MSDALADLSAQDVSVWLDDISRERLRSGNLQKLVDTKHVVGVTSNPTIFQKALEKGDAYNEQVRDLKMRELDIDEAVRMLMAYDIRGACDVLRPIFDRTDGKDGRVSIEVDPRLAHETRAHHRRGARALVAGRPPERHDQDSCDRGGAARDHRGDRRRHQRQRHPDLRPGPLRPGDGRLPRPGSSRRTRRASTFDDPLGRVVLRQPRRHEIDKRLDKFGTDEAKELRGKAGIANARLAYERYEKVFAVRPLEGAEDGGRPPAATVVGEHRGRRTLPTPT